jgi:hypothetical protein
MSIEYFRPECNRPVDADGFELPPWDNPFFTIPDDVEPSEADAAWLNENPPPVAGGSPGPFVPTAADWADYHAWCRQVDERAELQRMEDAEYEARARFG